MNKKIKKLVLIAIFTSLVCVISPIAIYIGPIPISLSLFILLIVNGIFTKFEGIFITLLYILLGCIGLPVFANGMGGISILLGPTGGFIIGYLFCSIVVSLISNLNNKSTTLLILSFILGTLLCYTIGIIHYISEMNSTLSNAIMYCVYPFVLVDTIKISVAFIVTIILRNKIK